MKPRFSPQDDLHGVPKRRGAIPRRLWRWMKRRAAIEPSIGHLKQEHRMDRNRLHGRRGDQINAILSAAGMNFGKLIRHAGPFLRRWLRSQQSRARILARTVLFHTRHAARGPRPAISAVA